MKIISLIFLTIILTACKEKVPTVAEQACMQKYANVTIHGESIYVRNACSQDELTIGLKNIKRMDEDVGMLFIFGFEKKLSFWMKDTYIPLDIAFINDNLEIVDIQSMKPHDETPIESNKPASFALEVSKGYFNKHKVKIGDKIEVNFTKNQ